MRKLSQETWWNLPKASQLLVAESGFKSDSWVQPLSHHVALYGGPHSKQDHSCDGLLYRRNLGGDHCSVYSDECSSLELYFLQFDVCWGLIQENLFHDPISSFPYVTFQGSRIFSNHRWTCLITCFLIFDSMSPIKLISQLLGNRDKLYKLWSINSPLNIFLLFLKW